MRRIHCLIAVAAALLCCVIPLLAGQNLIIIEGADPVGSQVRLLIGNSALETQSGTGFVDFDTSISEGHPKVVILTGISFRQSEVESGDDAVGLVDDFGDNVPDSGSPVQTYNIFALSAIGGAVAEDYNKVIQVGRL